MIRKFLFPGHADGNGRADKRDYEIQRIETFSDGVFAFAVTLLIVSLEVPKSFEELVTSMRGFFAFGISFLILVSIWAEQHWFFRKYGMEDSWTIALNGALLFIVLFYTYPLKFLFTLFFSDQIYGVNKSPLTITAQQMPELMEIYALGFIAIYSLFFLMYLRAFRKSEELGLTSLEKFDCRTGLYKKLIMAIVGLCSLIAAALIKEEYAGATGLLYILITPALTIFYAFRKRARRKLFPSTVVNKKSTPGM
jgi:uncharacterized membrane protein